MSAFAQLPFGCRDCKITPWTNATTLGTAVDLPRIRTVELSTTTDSTDLEGDDVRIATHNFGKGLEGSIEAGGINAAALAAIEGGTITTSGTTPNRISTYKVLGDQSQLYFKLEAQMYGDDGGDIHFIGWKLKATNGPNYSFTQGEFALTACDVAGIFDDSVSPSRLYHIVQNETITAIA